MWLSVVEGFQYGAVLSLGYPESPPRVKRVASRKLGRIRGSRMPVDCPSECVTSDIALARVELGAGGTSTVFIRSFDLDAPHHPSVRSGHRDPVPILVQLAALLPAGYLLWILWRTASRTTPVLAVAVTFGFLIRAFASQFLFWVSWLKLPFARSLQLGRGFWFFGLDGVAYFGYAKVAADNGAGGIFSVEPNIPSPAFVHALALFVWIFGEVVSVAILLNCAIYLASMLLVLRWSERHQIASHLTAIPVFGMSFLPAILLWSLQPLKDPFFMLLILLLALLLNAFYRGWSQPRPRVAALWGIGALLVVAVYLVAGVRWYYALIALVAAAAAGVGLLTVREPREIIVRLVSVVLLVAVGLQALVAGAGMYVPPAVRSILQPWEFNANSSISPFQAVTREAASARANMDAYVNATTAIRSGARTSNEGPGLGADELRPVESKSVPPATGTVQPTSAMVGASQTTPKPTAAKPTAPKPTAAKPTALKPTAPLVQANRPSPGRRDAHAAVARPSPPPMPKTTAQRLIAGGVALLLPRSLGNALGLISIGGGRGMMWFADVDTVLMDILLLIVLAVIVRSFRRGAWKDVFVWYLLFVTVGIFLALAYTISNYGTLLRHRGMMLTTAMLLAIVAPRISSSRATIAAEANSGEENGR
jgi:hypothetical protein